MLVIPAVDLKGGRCVRLLQGRAEAETVFSDDPVATAERWEAEGAPRLHVVDLDGAFGGGPAQMAIIRAIARAVSIPLEVGGGLRTPEQGLAVLEGGAPRGPRGGARPRLSRRGGPALRGPRHRRRGRLRRPCGSGRLDPRAGARGGGAR